MGRTIERLRIKITWLFGALVFFTILFSSSNAEKISPIFDGFLMLFACVAAAVGAFGRLWASLYVAGYKDSKLIKVGPYSLCRNPLYFFSFVGAVGVGCATETMTIPALIALTFIVYYPFVVRAEEKRLAEIFGVEYDEYKKTTPSIFPKIGGKIDWAETWVVVPKTFARNIFDALWFVFFIGFLELVEELHEADILPTLFRLF